MREMVINMLQEGIPLCMEPFSVMSERIGIEGSVLLDIIKELKDDRIIRQISPIYDTRMLGYDSSLVAFKVERQRIEDVAGLVSSHTGVSHNYERGGIFNLWFTIATPPDSPLSLDETVRAMADEAGVEEYVILRSKRVFKIGVKLNPNSRWSDREMVEIKRHTFIPLTDKEKKIVRVTQHDIPIISRPFSYYASLLDVDEDELILKLREFKDRGVMRRFAAILFHRKAGFSANGMSVWRVPEERVEEVGIRMAGFRRVSHCYEREVNGVWHYNMFCMVHGRDRDEVESTVYKIGRETGIKDFLILYSLREFKKQRISYFTESDLKVMDFAS